MKIAACLILKNSADTIEACLASIRPFVDEVCVYDTGSTDDTLDVLKRLSSVGGWVISKETGERVREQVDFGQLVDDDPHYAVPLAPIRVEQGEWRDDFSWAREQSFRMVSDDVDWLLWLDDDDLVENAQQLRFMAWNAQPEIDGFVLQYDYARDELGNCVCELWRERLMRRSANYTWRGAVHEVLVPPEGKAPMLATVPREQIRYVHHRPPDRYDQDRNLKILLAELERVEAAGEIPEPRTLAYVGTELMAKQRYPDAAGYLQAYLERPDVGWSDERMQVAHKLATCMRAIGNPLAACEIEFQALKERDDWAETAVGLCESFAMLGRWDRCETWARRALELGQPQSMLILNPLEFTFLPLVRLAEACIHQGRHDDAVGYLAQAEQLLPNHPLLAERRGEYERARYEAHLVNAVLVVREALVRHDENKKALELLESAPYLVADHPAIVRARADQREMCKHLLHPEEYLRWYRDDPKESTLTDDHIDMVGEAFGRVAALEQGLAEQEEQLGRKPVLLDLGCNDWWMGEYFARRGIRCDGVELNQASYDKAIERRDRFERDATIVQGDLHQADDLLARARGIELARWQHPGTFGLPDELCYDAVSLFEVLEHVPDIGHTLSVLESLVRPGGRVYISTPNGAFEQGNLPNWHKVERKGHLRAIPIHELADLLNSRGHVEALEETNGDRVSFAAYTPAAKKGRVVLYAGASWEPWSPESIHTTGLGGSESALVQLAVRLATDGYQVKVYSGAEPGLYGGALFRPHTAWDPTEDCDLLIVSRLPHVFDNPIGAKRTALWCHDHSYPGAMTPERASRIDNIVVLSDWERDRYARLYPYLADKLVVIRNGITVADMKTGDDLTAGGEVGFGDRAPRCVFSSSADRGLDVLLDLWPEIREQVPDAELHVFYGFDVFDRVALAQPHLAAYKAQLLHRAGELGGEDGGIFLRGRVGQRQLAAEMREARVWAYPTAFLETSCIGAMEARAAGLAIVTSDLGALTETVGSHGQLIPWATNGDGRAEDEPHNRTPEYRSWFVREVSRLLSDRKHWQAWHRRARAGVAELDWSNRVAEWEQLLAPAREAVAA